MGIKTAIATGILIASCALVACGPPVYRTGYAAYVAPAPPAPYGGVVGYAPGPGYVWVDGFWDLRGGRWAWVNGRWDRPPHRGAHWDRDRWERHGNGWRYHRGHWR